MCLHSIFSKFAENGSVFGVKILIDKQYYDSDVSDKEIGEHDKLNTTGDDTSTEVLSRHRVTELSNPNTSPMTEGKRQLMKRILRVIGWMLDLDAAMEIPLNLLKKFCDLKLNRPISNVLIEDMFDEIEISLRCQYVKHGMAFGDEISNHGMHIGSILLKNKDKHQWTLDNWCIKFGNIKLLKEDENYKNNSTANNNLAHDKQHQFVETYSNSQIRAIVKSWLINEIESLTIKMNNCKHQPKNFKKIKISMYGFTLVFQIILVIISLRLLSFVKLQKQQGSQRQIFLDQSIIDWIYNCYQDGNQLPYLILYEGIDRNGKLNPKLVKGIPSKLDWKLSISRFASNETDQKGILEHYLMALHKMLLWWPMLDVILSGHWFWSNASMHVGFQKLNIVMKNLLNIHYWYSAHAGVAEPLPQRGQSKKRMKYANSYQMRKYKVAQEMQFYWWSFADPEIAQDSIHNQTFCRFSEDHFWSLPTSCAFVSVSSSTIEYKSRTLGKIVYRHCSESDSAKQYAENMKTYNMIKCNCNYKKLEGYFNNKTYLKQINKISDNMMDSLLCDFGTNGYFVTELDDKIVNMKFAKYSKLVPSKRWTDKSKHLTKKHLLIGVTYYGKQWRWLNHKQWEACNTSINFKTAAIAQRRYGFEFVEEGMQVIGDDWDVTDTESEMEELPSQQQALQKMLHKKSVSNNTNTNDNVQSNNNNNYKNTKNTTKFKQANKEPWNHGELNDNDDLNEDEESDDSDGYVCTSKTAKYQSSESESELLKPKSSLNSQQFLTQEMLTMENQMFGDDEDADNEIMSDSDDETLKLAARSKTKTKTKLKRTFGKNKYEKQKLNKDKNKNDDNQNVNTSVLNFNSLKGNINNFKNQRQTGNLKKSNKISKRNSKEKTTTNNNSATKSTNVFASLSQTVPLKRNHGKNDDQTNAKKKRRKNKPASQK